MRLRILLTFVLFAFVATSYAQYKPFTFGLKAGPQISWLRPNVDKYENDGMKMGIGWGFIAEFNFSENHTLATGFNMLFNGGKLAFPELVKIKPEDSILTQVQIHRDYSLRAFEIPLTLKMRTNNMGGFFYYGQIGLGTAINVGAKTKDAINNGEYGEKAKYDKIFFIRESLLIGAGAEYEIPGGTRIGAGLIFNNGFTDVLEGRNTFLGKNEKAAPNYFGLDIFVIF